jgi:hypothetical protein
LYTTTAAINAAKQKITAGLYIAAGGKLDSLSKTDDIFDAGFTGECENSYNHGINLASVGRDATNRQWV